MPSFPARPRGWLRFGASFLASADAGFITGQVLDVRGGLSEMTSTDRTQAALWAQRTGLA